MVHVDRNEIIQFVKTKEFFEYPYQNRQSRVEVKLESQNDLESIPNASDYLVAFSSQNHSYCVGCVDMVNSTKISASMSPHNLSGYYEIFLNSMSKIIGKFGGKVIKNVGDCLLFYFPASKDSKNMDGLISAIDCGLAMTEAQQPICQELAEKKLPCLNYRISADYGTVLIMNTTDSQQIDMIGPPVNMCTKINRCAHKNEFVIGSDLHLIAKKIQKFKFTQTKSCDVGFAQSYPTFIVEHRKKQLV
ncbi:MAG TPA: adenylate/guanylate cyclase domain-containing protein [Nitrosopumilaceae archaeon]|nr:adenylate/guanylate cyclase domain-containing protein [Nitrosopumilaceae archaeon]